jgi:hypothetical protein
MSDEAELGLEISAHARRRMILRDVIAAQRDGTIVVLHLDPID